jgi:hypothetical protein
MIRPARLLISCSRAVSAGGGGGWVRLRRGPTEPLIDAWSAELPEAA